MICLLLMKSTRTSQGRVAPIVRTMLRTPVTTSLPLDLGFGLLFAGSCQLVVPTGARQSLEDAVVYRSFWDTLDVGCLSLQCGQQLPGLVRAGPYLPVACWVSNSSHVVCTSRCVTSISYRVAPMSCRVTCNSLLNSSRISADLSNIRNYFYYVFSNHFFSING
jgi:hypothetical protein